MNEKCRPAWSEGLSVNAHSHPSDRHPELYQCHPLQGNQPQAASSRKVGDAADV